MGEGNENVTLMPEGTQQQKQQHTDLGFEVIDDLQEAQQHAGLNIHQNQQQNLTMQGQKSKGGLFSKEKDYFIMKKNPTGNKDKGVSKKEKKVVERIHGYHEVKKTDDYNHANAKQAERNEVLIELCQKEKGLISAKNNTEAGKAFLETLQLIEKYAQAKDYEVQQSSLEKALNAIDNYIDKFRNPEDDASYELLERIKNYSYYFETNVNGALKVDKDIPLQKNPNAGLLNTWKDVSNYKLFPHEPSVNDVKQRATEDCYMLSSLSAIAYHNPEQIKESMKDNGDGTVTVRFYANDEKEVFYENESTASICKQGLETEEQKVKVLTKLISKYFQDGTFVEQCVQERNQTAGFVNTRQELEQIKVNEEQKTQTNEKFEFDDSELDEDLEELEFMSKEHKQQETIGLSEASYKNSADTIMKLLSSNNIEWYSEFLKSCLNEEGKMRTILGEALNRMDENISEEVESQIMKNLLHELVVQGATVTEMSKYNRELRASGVDARVNRPVYVKVKKEISTIAGGIELNAADSLWVQMIEKAYAARFGTHDQKEGYAGISLGNSSVFLERFNNQNYKQDEICPCQVEDIKDEEERVIISKNDLEKAIKGIGRIDNMSITIENIVKIITGQSGYEGLTLNTIERIKEQLEIKGFMHDEFSGKYSEKANDFYEDTKERLERKEIITVGVDLQGTLYSDREKRKKELNSTGIRTGHAYAIIRCFEADGHKFVTLRDPYGLFKRSYDVRKENGEIVGVEKKDASKLSLSGTDTMGMFNMELNDFLLTFNNYSGIKI